MHALREQEFGLESLQGKKKFQEIIFSPTISIKFITKKKNFQFKSPDFFLEKSLDIDWLGWGIFF